MNNNIYLTELTLPPNTYTLISGSADTKIPNPEQQKKQKEYEKRADEAIRGGLSLLKDNNEEKGEGISTRSRFFRLLDFLSEKRHRIAQDHDVFSKENFGRYRTDTREQGYLLTPLRSEAYDEYNQKLISFFQERLKNAIPVTGPIVEKDKHREILIKHRGTVCRMQIEILEIKDLESRHWIDPTSHPDAASALKQLQSFKRTFAKLSDCELYKTLRPTKKQKELLQEYNKVLQSSVKKFPDLHEADNCSCILKTKIATSFSSCNDKKYRKSHYILAKLFYRDTENSEEIPLTQYLTWAYQTELYDPIEWMTGRSVVFCIHQDRVAIPKTLALIEKNFEKALSLKITKDTVKDLSRTIGKIRYLFAHCTPFCRGSAAIAEWLEKTLYRYHGIDCKQKKPADLVALAAPFFSTFMGKNGYITSVELRRLKTQ